MSSSLSFENIDALESPSHQSSHSQSTTPVPTPTQNTYAAAGSRGVDEESKFAPLFNPSTPKASPTMTPVPDAVMDAQIKSGFSEPIHIKSHSRRSGSVSSQSDFGSFVSVAEFDDPLSADFGSFEEQQLPNPLESASKQSAAPASKTFFDAVTKDATKSAAERRSLILDELLEHEDDPMYFLKDLKFGGSAKPEPDINKSLPPAMSPTSPAPNPPPKSPSAWKIHSPPLPPHQSPPVDVEDGLDHHYFASPQSNIVDPKQPLSRRSSNLARTASLPLTTPPSLAPPISSPNVVAQSSTSYLNVDPLDLNKTDTNPQANLSSYQSLSNIPTKWMSSLLRPSSIPSQGAKPSLESIFNDHLSNSGSPSSSPSSTHSSLQDSRRRGSSNSPTRAKTLPQPIQPNITHGTPFAPATITHSNSPFASHVYIPPSGAPGFKGEGYDWDKGFSTQLEHERLAHQNQLSQNAKPLPPITQSPPPWDRDNDSHDDLTSHQDRKWSSETTASKGGWANTFGSFGFGSLRGTKPAVSRSIGPEGFAGEPGQRQPHSVYTERGRSRDRPSVPDAGEWCVGTNINKTYSNPPPTNRNQMPVVGMGEFIDKATGGVELKGRKASTDPILTPELAGSIRSHLPALFRLPKAWSLIYSLDQHGISLNTLYTLSEKHYSRPPKPGELGNTGMLLVIKDSGDTVFGAWLGEGIRTRHLKGNSHFGGGESFLWKYSNSRLQIFRCTGKNNYTALVEPQYISFGGGDGHYGLYLDESLFEGSSAPCPTFQNDPLCSPGEKKGSSVVFECVGLEVWAMV